LSNRGEDRPRGIPVAVRGEPAVLGASSGGSGNWYPGYVILTSPNGINWTYQASPLDLHLPGTPTDQVAYSPHLGLWIASSDWTLSGSLDSLAVHSSDGKTWTSVVSPQVLANFVSLGVAGFAGISQVEFNYETPVLCYSSDGVTWTADNSRVLTPGPDDTPGFLFYRELPAPVLVVADLVDTGTGGTLAANTAYAYVATFVNANGQTTGSTERAITTGGGAGTHTVTITAPLPDGSSEEGITVDVYGRIHGSLGLIAQGIVPTGSEWTWIDTGAVAPAAAVPSSNTTGNVFLAYMDDWDATQPNLAYMPAVDFPGGTWTTVVSVSGYPVGGYPSYIFNQSVTGSAAVDPSGNIMLNLIAQGDNGSAYVATQVQLFSTDGGMTWAQTGATSDQVSARELIYGAGVWLQILVTDTGNNAIYTSADNGNTWTVQASAAALNPQSLATDGTTVVAVGVPTDLANEWRYETTTPVPPPSYVCCMTSTDGVNWVPRKTPFDGVTWGVHSGSVVTLTLGTGVGSYLNGGLNGIAYSPDLSLYVAVGYSYRLSGVSGAGGCYVGSINIISPISPTSETSGAYH